MHTYECWEIYTDGPPFLVVAVITFIICIANIIPSIMDLSDPFHAQGHFVWRALQVWHPMKIIKWTS